MSGKSKYTFYLALYIYYLSVQFKFALYPQKKNIQENIQETLRDDVKLQLPWPPMCRSQSPPAATEMLEQLYLEYIS